LKTLCKTLTSVTAPCLWEWEFEEVREIVGREVYELNKDAETIAFEKLHRLAFRDNGLGNSLYINQYDFKRLHPQHVQKHISDFFFPGNRMVIVGVGAPHDKLVENLNEFGNIKNQSGTFELDVYEPLPQVTPTPQEIKYYGGEALIEGGKNTFVGLGFPGSRIHKWGIVCICNFKRISWWCW